MTGPTNNPLDRIRSLAPADMTDDELGVACEMVGDRIKSIDGPEPYWESDSCWVVHREYTAIVWKITRPNPALSYDALLPIVREWVGRSPRRIKVVHQNYVDMFTDEYNPQGIGELIEADTNDLLDITDTTVWCFLQATPRQLAEAFVTAAREVARE